MQYRILGKTGLKVSAVGFGGIPIQRIDAKGVRYVLDLPPPEPEATTETAE